MKAIMIDPAFFGGDVSLEAELIRRAGIDFEAVDVRDADDFAARCQDADAILMVHFDVDAALVERLQQTKLLVRYGVGYDSVDVDACTRQGIAVCNIPHFCSEEVAVQAVGLALDCVRKLTFYDRAIRNGQYTIRLGYTMTRLSTMTVGLLGFGNIARTAARYFQGFGCTVIASDPYAADELFANARVRRVTQEELLAGSDLISVHVPLMENTHHLLDTPQFKLMKRGAIVINTSRGGLIREEALCDALDDGTVLAAGLDVQETEPLIGSDARILQYDTVVLTPHSGAQSRQAIEDLHRQVAETVIAVLRDGQFPDNVLNRAALLEQHGVS